MIPRHICSKRIRSGVINLTKTKKINNSDESLKIYDTEWRGNIHVNIKTKKKKNESRNECLVEKHPFASYANSDANLLVAQIFSEILKIMKKLF